MYFFKENFVFCLKSAKSNLKYNTTKTNTTSKLFKKKLDIYFVRGAHLCETDRV